MAYFKIRIINHHLIICIFYTVYLINGEQKLGDGQMKAIVLKSFGDPENFHVEVAQIPKIKKGQMLIKVKAAGINPIDAYIRSGRYPRKPVLPAILGKEIAGIVEAVNVTNSTFQKGDKVFCGIEHGGYAEYAAASTKSCYPLGELSFAEGASVYIVYLAAFRAVVIDGNLKSNETILINGDNVNIAAAAVQVAKYVGSCVVACVGNESLKVLDEKNQADYRILRDRKTDVLSPVLEKLNKTGFEVVLECDTKANIAYDKRFLAKNDGRLLIMGNRNVTKGGHARGIDVRSVSFYKHTKKEEQAASYFFQEAIKNRLISPTVFTKYNFDNAAEAHKDILSSKAALGKLIFEL